MSRGPAQPPEDESRPAHDEPPPILGAWRNLYALVALLLALEILFCGWVSSLSR